MNEYDVMLANHLKQSSFLRVKPSHSKQFDELYFKSRSATDSTGKSQLSKRLRYINNKGKPQKTLIGFSNASAHLLLKHCDQQIITE